MSDTYYDPKDLKNFKKITDWSEPLGTRFFEYYSKVFEEGALSAREKSLIALAVSHVVKCPYCIDAYTKDGLQRGIRKYPFWSAGSALRVPLYQSPIKLSPLLQLPIFSQPP